jgi:SagB-type dehydrogenase family enzyme
LRHAGTAQWGAAPPPFKRYAGAERLALPALGSVVRTDAPPGELPLLAEVLWHTAGVSLVRGGIHFRTSPSSGALFATELYVAGPAAGALRGRWWHYDAERHALESIERPAASDGAAAFALPSRGGESLLVVATAVFARSGHKYGDRTWRYVLADAGHALENLLRVAHGLGAGTWLEPHFDDAAVAAALALDERREGVLALLQLVAEAAAHRPNGAGNTSAAAAPSERAAGFVWHATPLRAADSAADLTAAMQRASSLRATRPLAPDAAAAASAAAPASATAGSPASPRELVALPPPRDLPADVRSLIARRRSIRRYGARALGLQELSTVLAAAQDVHAARTRAVHVDLVAIRVSGLAAGAWSAGDLRGGLARRAAPPRSDWASSARAAGLDQDVIGEAAVVLVFSLDRAALAADPAGPVRAYRHAFIEAGRAGERVYLAAGQHGLGCCSVGAFYDDEVAALLGRDPAQHWAIHIVALGPLA